MQETEVQSLGWKDPLQKAMATHFSILAWEVPWTEEPGGYSPWGRKGPNSNWDCYNCVCNSPNLSLSLVCQALVCDLQGGISVSASLVKVLQSDPTGLQSQIL